MFQRMFLVLAMLARAPMTGMSVCRTVLSVSIVRRTSPPFLLSSLLLFLALSSTFITYSSAAKGVLQQSSSSVKGDVSVSTEQQPGLNRVVFSEPGVGRIFVNLPDDAAAGDVVTGTVFAEPVGEGDAAAKNREKLQQSVIAVGGKKLSLSDKSFELALPPNLKASSIAVQLFGNKEKLIAKQDLPALAQQPVMPTDVSLPAYGQTGQFLAVACRCDGRIAATDYVKVGDKEILVLAESPRQRAVLNTNGAAGLTQIEFSENGQITKAPYRNISLKMTVSNSHLKKGEQATLHIEVRGLEDLKEDIPLHLENRSTSVLTLGGGDKQAITIRSSEVQAGGLYATDRALTGVMVGAFYIDGIVRWQNGATFKANQDSAANFQDVVGNEASLERYLKGTKRATTTEKIPAPFVEALKREYERSPEIQKETKFPAFLASRYFWLMERVELAEGRYLTAERLPKDATLSFLSSMCLDGTCDGPLNPAIWTGAWTGGIQGDITTSNLPIAPWTAGLAPNNNSIPDTSCGAHPSQAHHSIVPNGNDPIIPSIKTVAPVPASGNVASLRLGNRCPLYGGERISKTFTVVPGQTTLQFWYATVLQDPGHAASDQPGFGTYLLNGSTPVTNRIDIDPGTPGKQEFIVADRNNAFFGYNQSLGIVYRDWTCVTIDLSGLEGQTLTLLLVNRDCTLGGHWGYSYVDSFCLGCAGNPTGDATFNAAKSDCATGKICFDYTVPKLANGTTGKANLTLDLYQNGVLVNTLTSGDLTTNGTYCFNNVWSSVNAAVGGFDWRATANFTATGATISPIVIGTYKEEGNVTGKNNDCVLPPKPIDPCCPPWNKDLLKDMMFYQGSGSISAPYTLHFQPTAALKNQIQAYLDYMHSVNPAITKIVIDWELHNGTYPSPVGSQIGVTATTTWNYLGGGNFTTTGDPAFFSQPPFPMQVGNWYYISAAIHLPRGQTFFSEKCTPVGMWVRIQVMNARGVVGGGGRTLEFSDGKQVIRSVPIGNEQQQR